MFQLADHFSRTGPAARHCVSHCIEMAEQDKLKLWLQNTSNTIRRNEVKRDRNMAKHIERRKPRDNALPTEFKRAIGRVGTAIDSITTCCRIASAQYVLPLTSKRLSMTSGRISRHSNQPNSPCKAHLLIFYHIYNRAVKLGITVEASLELLCKTGKTRARPARTRF